MNHYRLGEVCSHVAGLLFKVEASIRLPELLTNKLKLTGIPHNPHSQDDEEADDDDDDGVYCLCREPAYGPMIACDSPECPNEWFHFQCVGLDVEPTGEWFCNECNSVS